MNGVVFVHVRAWLQRSPAPAAAVPVMTQLLTEVDALQQELARLQAENAVLVSVTPIAVCALCTVPR